VIAAIVNPCAGSGAARRKWPRLARVLEERLGAFRTRFTESAGHASSIARELADEGCGLLIVAGGDGTLNEVVNGVLAASATARLGVLPLASGGDFARTLGVADLSTAVETVATGKCRSVDAFRARFRTAEGETAERCFVNEASFGLGALAARNAGRWSGVLPNRVRYLAAALPVLASGSSFHVSLGLDRSPPTMFDITTAAISNGQYQGGGIRISPEAVLDDGLADVTVVERVGLGEVARRLPILYSGEIYSHPRVQHWRAARVLAESDSVVPLELDGEPVGILPLEVVTLPGALRIMSPASPGKAS
jgi:YegS/Rv2252/BmrU family lipid kinase